MPGIQFGPPVFQAVNATPTRISTPTNGMPVKYSSFGLALSQDGRFAAYYGDPVALADGETKVVRNVFLADLSTGIVARVSVTADGVIGNGNSVAPIFVPGGNKLAFLSDADNWVPGDTNTMRDIFIKDLTTGAITRVSTNSDGSQLIGDTHNIGSGAAIPAFSADGRKMAFLYNTISYQGIYIKDLVTGDLTLAISNPDYFAGEPQFSPDGTKLLFKAWTPSQIRYGIFMKDLTTGTVTLVSTNAAGVTANGDCEYASFSSDGSHIVFASAASNLVPEGTNGLGGVFVKDLITGAVTQVSVNAAGVPGGGVRPVFSPDGTKVAFTGGETLSPNDSNHFGDIYVRDLLTGEIALVSVAVDGAQGPTGGDFAVWSPDGQFVGFQSDNLVQPDTGGLDVYLAKLNLPAAYIEGGPAVQVVPMARALDMGSTDYDQGSLTVAITGGSVAGDQLSLALSNAAGESIAVSGNQVLVNNVMVGTIVSSATSLTISFNANANNPVVELLTEAVRISSISHDPTAAVRTVTFTLVDGDGVQEGVTDTTSFTRKVAFIPVGEQHLAGTSADDVLHGGLGNDSIDGMAGNDIIQGGGGNDLIDGGSGRNAIYGEVGHDRLSATGSSGNRFFGGSDSDVIVGGAGDDLIEGGGGGDWLTGGAGADIFLFRFVSDSAGYSMRSDGKKVLNDVITDFTSGVDKINLEGIDAIDGGDMRDAFTFIGTAAFTHHAGELRYEIVDGQANIFADTNGDGFADMHIVAITATLTASDFIL